MYIYLCYSLLSEVLHGINYSMCMQAFKIIVTDPDSVLDSLTREVKEVGPDGQEVTLFIVLDAQIFSCLITKSGCFIF